MTAINDMTDAIQNATMLVSGWLLRTEDGEIWERDGSIWKQVRPESLTTRIVMDTKDLAPWGTTANGQPYPLVRLDKMGDQKMWAQRIINEIPEVDYADLNSSEHALWLNTPDGEVWLGPGQAPQAPRAKWTYCTSVSPQAGPTPLFDAFIAGAFDTERERAAVVTLLGLMLRGEAVHSKVPVFQGDAATGKTTVALMVNRLLGTYGMPLSSTKLSRSNSSHEEWLAELVGKRLVVVEELPDGTQMNSTLLKALMSGGEISARRLRRNRFTFVPQFTFAIATNELPNVATSDPGIKRRLSYVRMDNVIPVENRYASADKFVTHVLEQEGPAVLHKLIEASRTWDGTYPQVSGEETAILIEQEMSGVARWIDERCEVGAGWTPTKVLHAQFVEWAQRANHADQHIKLTPFGRDLKQYTDETSTQKRWNGGKNAVWGYPITVMTARTETQSVTEDALDPAQIAWWNAKRGD